MISLNTASVTVIAMAALALLMIILLIKERREKARWVVTAQAKDKEYFDANEAIRMKNIGLKTRVEKLKKDNALFKTANSALVKQLEEINNIPVFEHELEAITPVEDTLRIKVQSMVEQLRDVDFFLQQYSNKRQLITAFRMQLERWLS